MIQKPATPVEEWTGKTILFIGAHADDDAISHGTFAMLQARGNQFYILTLTTGNVGTQDPNLSREQFAVIRREEELAALKELGVSADHYITLGYYEACLSSRTAKQWSSSWCAISGSCARRPDGLGPGQGLSAVAQIRSPSCRIPGG